MVLLLYSILKSASWLSNKVLLMIPASVSEADHHQPHHCLDLPRNLFSVKKKKNPPQCKKNIIKGYFSQHDIHIFSEDTNDDEQLKFVFFYFMHSF